MRKFSQNIILKKDPALTVLPQTPVSDQMKVTINN